jgi:hypothetical protein
MVFNGLLNTAQGGLSVFDVINSGKFSLGDFLEGFGLTGLASQEKYVAGRKMDEYQGAVASQDLGKQMGSILWDTAAMFVPAPIRKLFAVGNVIEAGKEALSGNWLDAGNNLLAAGMQFAGVKGVNDLGAKIAAKNPNLTNAVKQLAVDVPKNIQLKASLKNTPTPVQLKKSGALTESGSKPLSRKDVVAQIRSTTKNINQNTDTVVQELKQEASNLTAKAAQKAGAGWQHVSSNFKAGRNLVANS